MHARAIADPRRTTPLMFNTIRGALALVLLDEDRWPEAQLVARDACLAVPAPQIQAQLQHAELCGKADAQPQP